MDDQIDIRTGRRMAIGVEPAERHVRAGEQRQGEGARRPFRQGARAPRYRHRAVGRDEAIEIPAAGLETVDVQLRGMIRIAGGGDAAATDDAHEVGRVRHLGRQRGVGRSGKARPQQHRPRTGLAARDPVGEALCRHRLRRAGQGHCGKPCRAELHQQAAIHFGPKLVHQFSSRLAGSVPGFHDNYALTRSYRARATAA